MKLHGYTQAEGEFDEYFFEKNLQGDIVAVYNMDGEKIGTYTYDAWGNFTVTLTSGNTSLENEVVNSYNPYRYRGYYYDVETGLYYLQSRYYNPAWGRFISADGYVSTGQGLLGNNMFAYCENSPIMGYDPLGESTTSFGLSLSFGFFGSGYSFSLFFSFDDDDTIALQWAYSVPNDEETRNIEIGVNIGASVFIQETELDNVSNLEGGSKSVGAATGPSGYDAIYTDKNENVGNQFSIGVGISESVHVNETKTDTIFSFKSIMSWIGGLFGI